MPDSIDVTEMFDFSRRQGARRIVNWMAQHGQGDIKGWLLEASEYAIENGEVDGPSDD